MARHIKPPPGSEGEDPTHPTNSGPQSVPSKHHGASRSVAAHKKVQISSSNSEEPSVKPAGENQKKPQEHEKEPVQTNRGEAQAEESTPKGPGRAARMLNWAKAGGSRAFATAKATAMATAARWRRTGWFGRSASVLAIVLTVAILTSTWAAFRYRSRHAGRVGPEVSLAGKPISGQSEAEVRQLLRSEQANLSTSAVIINLVDGNGLTTDAEATGLVIDEDATLRKVMALNQGVRGWMLAKFNKPVDVQREFRIDPKRLQETLHALMKGGKDEDEPSEAKIALNTKSKKFEGMAGKAGLGISPDRLSEELQRAAREGLRDGQPFTITIQREQITPRFTKQEADRLALEADQKTAQPLQLQSGGVTGSIAPETLRGMVNSLPTPEGLRLMVSEKKAADAAAKALAAVGSGAVEAKYSINTEGKPVFTPGKAGRVCCEDGTGKLVADAILQSPSSPVEVPSKEVRPRFGPEDVEKLKINEAIGTFYTDHAPGQSRVKNIHRAADVIRGWVILPGETFSLNGALGPRTKEKGYVEAGVIEDGRATENLGGGVSQLSTTLFNAAFFSGLPIPEYSMHSIYYSRYPYGREATLSFPKPDLKIHNDSPYGILIWTSYSNTRISVTLYSTKRYAKVQQGKQGRFKQQACTGVTTERIITMPDGSTKVDKFSASYQPGDGVLCDGSVAPPRKP